MTPDGHIAIPLDIAANRERPWYDAAIKFGCKIMYLADVLKTAGFYETAFGLKRLMIHESNLHAEMDTGSTTLAFAAEDMAEVNGPKIRQNSSGHTPQEVHLKRS